MLIYANPTTFTPRLKAKAKKRTPATGRKAATKKGASAMAKKHRSAAQKAATARMIAANKRRKRHKNPSSPKVYRKRHARRAGTHRKRRYRNPSTSSGGGFFKSFLSMEGAVELGAAIVAPLAVDLIQKKVMPTATGITKLAIKTGLAIGGGWAIDKFLKKRMAAKIFTVVGLSVIAMDAWRYYKATGQLGLEEQDADYLSTRPELMDALVSTDTSTLRPMVGMSEPYSVNLSDPYSVNLSDAFSQPFG